MSKKALFLIVVIIILIIALVFIINNTNKNNQNTTSTADATKVTSNSDTNVDSKILVVYFSAQNHTKDVATHIAERLNADIFEIVPKDKYSESDLNYNSSLSRVSREHNNESMRNIELVSNKVSNWDNYNTVILGYPIWWGIAAWPVNSFVKENDFTGKTVFPFCTSVSSGIGESATLLESECRNGYWESGFRFNSNPGETEYDEFLSRISRDVVTQ